MYYIAIVVILSSLIGVLAVNDPGSVQGITMAVFWGCVLAIALCRSRKRGADGNWLVRVMLIGLLVRFGMAFVHLAVGFWFYGGQLDFPGYHRSGVNIGRGFFQGDLGDTLIGNLHGIYYLIVGPGIVGMVLLSGIIGFLGSYLFLRAFDLEFRNAGIRDTRFLALSLFLLPSLTYWAILLGKDSWIFLFLGWVSYAFVNLLKRFSLSYLSGLLIGIGAIAAIRLPVAGIVAFAAGFAWLLREGQSGPAAIFRPLRYVFYPVVIVGLLIGVLSVYLARYESFLMDASLFESALQLAVHKHVGLSIDAGGSSLGIGITRSSKGAVLRYLPFGMFSFLFRPLIFEAHNALALVAALESTFYLVLVLWRRRSLIAAMRCIFSRPFVGFCTVTFFFLLVILSLEANFGVIVRHRTMVLPFLFILLAVPRKNKRSGQIAASSAKADG